MDLENKIIEIIGDHKFHFNKLTGYYHLGSNLKTDKFLFQYRPGNMVLHVSLYEVALPVRYIFDVDRIEQLEEVLLPIMNKIFNKTFSQIWVTNHPPILELKLRKLRDYCKDNVFDKKVVLPKYFNYGECEFNYDDWNIDVEKRENYTSYHLHKLIDNFSSGECDVEKLRSGNYSVLVGVKGFRKTHSYNIHMKIINT